MNPVDSTKTTQTTPLFLADSDVSYEIFKQIACYDKAEKGSYQKARVNLISAALCCKGFKDGCLDVLWSKMPSIVPLLKLLPGIKEFQGRLARSATETSFVKN